MNKFFSIVLLLFSFISSIAQSKSQFRGLTLKGQIKNYNKNYLLLQYEAVNGVLSTDTIQLDDEKNFDFKTKKINKPMPAWLGDTKLFIAPGYDLSVSADGKDIMSFYRSKKISGRGSESNDYLFILDSIKVARMDTTNYLLLNETEMLAYIKEQQLLHDSIVHRVFDRKSKQDQYLTYFEKLVRLDNKFMKLYLLLTHVNDSKYDYTKSVEFIRTNFDTTLLNNFYRDEFLQSEYYKDWVIAGAYLNYLLNLDYKKDPTLKKRNGYDLERVDKMYKGKVREYVMFRRIAASINRNKTIKDLNDNKQKYETYTANFTNSTYKDILEDNLKDRAAVIERTQTGKPAPSFSLKNESGKIYNLSDFRGKVVYLDLWASWCKPCREETPYLKQIYERYKDEKGLVIVSVSVDEELQRWKEALIEDKPTWLQLIDEDKIVFESYVPNMIPKFIVINKKGNIVDFDAPRPSNKEKLEEILSKELAKE
jgi:thiol-disulfide isomerase/thioredoxin